VLGGCLRDRAAGFLRGLRPGEEGAGAGAGTGAESVAGSPDAVRGLRRTARRLCGALHTYRPLLDPGWADRVRTELGWLSGTLAREYVYAARLERLSAALQQLAGQGGGGAYEAGEAGAGGSAHAATGGTAGRAGTSGTAGTTGTPGTFGATGSGTSVGPPGEALGDAPTGGPFAAGAARAGALLHRRLTLARTRAHSAALEALASARFHALADAVAVLASEAPLASDVAAAPAHRLLVPLAEHARRQLLDAVSALPPAHPLPPPEARRDAAWHRVRLLLRQHRYAEEVLLGCAPEPRAPEECVRAAGPVGGGACARLAAASGALDRHREAAGAAAAAALAANTPRIAAPTAYALGALHTHQRHEVGAARAEFAELWRRQEQE